MTDICLILKETRERQGLSLEDVAQKTYIKLPYLQALEQGAVESLPAPVYTYGYIRQYAKLLGLDGSELVARFQQLERTHASDHRSTAMADMPADPYATKPNGNGAHADSFNAAMAALKGNGAPRTPDVEPIENRQARMQARDILAAAERDARELVHGAEGYADKVLSDLEGEIGKTLQIIRNGRQFLATRRQGGPAGY